MLFTAPGAAEFISGVIMQDKTIHQNGSAGVPLAQVLADQGIVPGIKVDTGAKHLAGSPAETITEGLDGLRDRRPTCIHVNARALGRYAALCQEQELVPIVSRKC
jgi:fructose-bisphosphate aldolase, class I